MIYLSCLVGCKSLLFFFSFFYHLLFQEAFPLSSVTLFPEDRGQGRHTSCPGCARQV